MNRIVIISSIVLVVVCGGLIWLWHSPQPKQQSLSTPKPTPLVRQSPARHLALEGTYFLLQRVALTTGSGVTGFAPGTKVNLVAGKDSISTVAVEQYKFEVPSSQLTNDLDVAARVAKADYAAQAQLSTSTGRQAQEYAQQQRDAIAALEKEETERERRHKSASRAPNSLVR
jgi:hypothetical protein